MRSLLWVVFMAIVATCDVVAQTVSHSTYGRQADKTQFSIQDPTDYSAVRAQLERASQKSFWQRAAEALVRPMSQKKTPWGLDMSANVGLAYTQQTNVAVAATIGGTYAMHKGEAMAPMSSFAVSGLVSVSGFFQLRLVGENYFVGGNDAISYSLAGGSMPTYFWGLGYAAADKNSRSSYTKDNIHGNIGYKRRLLDRLWVGASVDARYADVRAFDDLAMQYVAGYGRGEAFSVGLGLTVEYDSRDNGYNPSRGVFLSALGEVRPKALGDVTATLWHVRGVFNLYQALWRGAVAALDMYADMYSSATPWMFWPAAGGEQRLRGYYYGRYTDSKMASAQLELRQTIYGPFGVCVWGGAGTFFPSIKRLGDIKLLPDYGVGVRFAAGGRTILRVDCGFGRHSHGCIISVNEAF